MARLWRSVGKLSQAPRLIPDFTQAMDVIGRKRWRHIIVKIVESLTWPRSIDWKKKSSCRKCNMTPADYHRTVVKNGIILKISLLLQSCFFFSFCRQVSLWTTAYRYSSSFFRTDYRHWTGRSKLSDSSLFTRDGIGNWTVWKTVPRDLWISIIWEWPCTVYKVLYYLLAKRNNG